jgi:uncharacterized membrane protein YfcA
MFESLFAWVPDSVDTQFLLLGWLSVMVMAMAKAGFGGSVGLLSVPIMIFACKGNSQLATGLMLPILITCDYVNAGVWFGRWDWKIVRNLLVPGMILGIAAGAGIIWLMQNAGGTSAQDAVAIRKTTNNWMQLFIGMVSLSFVVIQGIQSLRKHPIAFKPGFKSACGTGVVAGVCSTLAHAAGPVTAMYLLPQRMEKEKYVATTVFFYWFANQIKLIPYFCLGLISTESLANGLVLVPAVPIGAVLGKKLAGKINQQVFMTIVYILLALTGLFLCTQSLGKLQGWWPW